MCFVRLLLSPLRGTHSCLLGHIRRRIVFHRDRRQMLALRQGGSLLRAVVCRLCRISVGLGLHIAAQRNTDASDRQQRRLALNRKRPSRCAEALHAGCLFSFSNPVKRHPRLHCNPCSPACASLQNETTSLTQFDPPRSWESDTPSARRYYPGQWQA